MPSTDDTWNAGDASGAGNTSDAGVPIPPDGTRLVVGGFDGDGDVLIGDGGNDWFVLGPYNATVEYGRQGGTDAVFGFHAGDVFRFAETLLHGSAGCAGS